MNKRFVPKSPAFEMPRYRIAKVPLMFDDIKVFIDSEETIFEETYVTGMLDNNRVVKFRKASLEFKA